MSTKEETMATTGMKLIGLSAAVGVSQVVEFTQWVDLITKIVLLISAFVYLSLLCWKNFIRDIATDRGWLDKYPSLRRRSYFVDPKETEPAPLPTLPRK